MALRDILVAFGVVVDQTQLDSAQKKTDTLIGTFGKAVGALKALGAAYGVQQLYGFISNTVKAADDIGDLAARIGVTTDELQVMKAVAEDAGTSFGAIQTGFKTLAAGVRDGGKAFAAMGISLQGANGHQKTTTELFWEAGEAIGAAEDQNKRLALAQKLFGRSALELIPIFTAEKGSLDELKEAAVVFSADFVEASDRVAKRQAIMAMRFERLRVIVSEKLLPVFERAVNVMVRFADVVGRFVQSGKAFQILLSVGAALALRWAAGFALVGSNLGSLVGWMFRIRDALALVWRILLRFVLPVLIVDELITLFRGGDTIIGRFIDKLFGIGAAAKFVENVKIVVQSLIDTISSLFNNTGDWEMAFYKASEGIAKVFDSLFTWIGQGFDKMLNWIGEKIVGLMRKLPGGELIFGKVGAEFDPEGNASRGIQFAPPSLAPSSAQVAAAGGSVNAPVEVTNNITVGEATPSQTRELARQAGNATAAAAGGRDRAATGAAFGLGIAY
jgi:hypothetical protein